MAFTKTAKKYASLDQVNSNGILKVEIVNPASPIDYTSLLQSIDGKLDELALIKSELQSANSTLTNIKGDTADIASNTDGILTQVTDTNTKLEDVKTKLDTQITKLEDLKTLVTSTNAKLDDANASLNQIEADTAAIKASIANVEADVAVIKSDIAAIKADIATIKADIATIKADTAAIKTAVQSIDSKLDTVITSLSSIESKLDTLHSDLTTINTTLQAEFDQTQVKLDEVKAAIEFAQDTFQVKDCAGNNVGTPQNVIKTVQLGKQITELCNTADVTDPIVTAIEEQTTALKAGKKQDFVSWVAAVNDTLTIPANKFTTVAMLAAKGEFKIENSTNDFSADVTASAGTLSTFVEIAEDGVGTATGATTVSQGFDTRANSTDLDVANNSFLVTCVRAGVLQLELYK